jgi:hypothetical protein
MVARAVELWLSGCGLVVARAKALAVELRLSGGGFVVARARPLCSSSFAAAALRQNAAAVASLAEAAAALLQRSVGCGSGSGQLGSSMIINKTRNNL